MKRFASCAAISTCQVKDAEFAMVISGSMTSPTGNMILRR